VIASPRINHVRYVCPHHRCWDEFHGCISRATVVRSLHPPSSAPSARLRGYTVRKTRGAHRANYAALATGERATNPANERWRPIHASAFPIRCILRVSCASLNSTPSYRYAARKPGTPGRPEAGGPPPTPGVVPATPDAAADDSAAIATAAPVPPPALPPPAAGMAGAGTRHVVRSQKRLRRDDLLLLRATC
jgi:hypothetical protein